MRAIHAILVLTVISTPNWCFAGDKKEPRSLAEDAAFLTDKGGKKGWVADGLEVTTPNGKEGLARLEMHLTAEKAKPAGKLKLVSAVSTTPNLSHSEDLRFELVEKDGKRYIKIMNPLGSKDPQLWADLGTLEYSLKGTDLTLKGPGIVGLKLKDGANSVLFKANNGWIQLFNGKDLTGWKAQVPASWKVKNGFLTGSGTGSSLIYEDGQFANFHLVLEASFTADQGSWVCVRAPALDVDKAAGYPAGYYVRVAPSAPDKFGALAIFTGDLLTSPRRVKEQLVKPGEWFTMEVIAQGDHLSVLVNGQQTLSLDDPKKELITGDPKKVVLKGFIALSIPGRDGETQFRSIDIQELPTKKAPDKK